MLQFTCQKGNIFGIEVQILAEVVVNLLYTLWPLGIIRVGFSLMDENALDDAVLLGNACHINESLVGIAIVLVDNILHPVALVVDILLVVVFVP